MRTAVMMLALLAALAACEPGGDPQAGVPRVPSAAAPAAAPSSSAPPESNYDKALRFTRCMNDALEAMYPDGAGRGRKVPDPVEGTALQTWVSVPPEVHQGTMGGAVSTGDGNGWQIIVPEIFDKCKHLLPAVWPVKEDPDDTRRFGAFYDCLRKRGIDIPKADANGIIMSNPNPEIQQTEEYKAAEAACRHLADDPAVKGGS